MNSRILLILIGLLSSCTTIQQDVKHALPPAIPVIVPVVIPIPVVIPVPVVIVPVIKTPTTPNIGKSIASVISVVGEPSGVVDPKPGIRYFQFSVHANKVNCVASYLTTRENDKAAWIIKEYIAPDLKIC